MRDEAALRQIIDGLAKKYSHFYLIPDYYEEEHAERIAACFGDLPVLTGGSGLMTALGKRITRLCGMTAEKELTYERPQKAVLLAGSCSEMTLKQVAYYRESGRASMQMDPEKLLSGEMTGEDVLAFLGRQTGDLVLLYSSDAPENVRRVQETGRERVSEILESLTAQAAKEALRQGRTRIIVAGGETSGAVTKALGFDSFYIGKSVAPGVPVMITCIRTDVRLVLKSGNFGQPDFFLKAAEMTAE